MGLPAIVLLIFDRVIPAKSESTLFSLAFLGIGIIFSVGLIDLMRMKAVEAYFANARSLILYQDACFALFWAFALMFVHPLLVMGAIFSGTMLFVLWKIRQPKLLTISMARSSGINQSIVEAVGLGDAFIKKTLDGEIDGDKHIDFQTIGQSTLVGLIEGVSIMLVLVAAAWLVISESISVGAALAAIIMSQLIVNVFVRCFQVQALRPLRPKLQNKPQRSKSFDHTTAPPQDFPVDNHLLMIEAIEDQTYAPFSAEVFGGLCLALIGPSGSAKSDILKSIATGNFHEGKIEFKGQHWGRDHPPLSPIGYAPSNPVFLHGSMVENITCFEPNSDENLAVELVRKLDPYEDVFFDTDYWHAKINEDFSAQGQIVSLARAFWRPAEIIILDMPETFLDKASKAGLMALILKAKTEGKIVLLATDDDYLMQAADEVVKLERGVVTDRGPMEDVLARHLSRWIRVSFLPTKRDAFRLSLWLDAQLPMEMDSGLKDRIKQTAQDMLFLAPRDKILNENDEILFDVRATTFECSVTMHDRGDVLAAGTIGDTEADSPSIQRILDATEDFEQSIHEGYRQFSAEFKNRDDDWQQHEKSATT